MCTMLPLLMMGVVAILAIDVIPTVMVWGVCCRCAFDGVVVDGGVAPLHIRP